MSRRLNVGVSVYVRGHSQSAAHFFERFSARSHDGRRPIVEEPIAVPSRPERLDPDYRGIRLIGERAKFA